MAVTTPFPGRTAQGGFTLLEMVMVMIILMIVAGVGASFVGGGFGAYFTGQELVPLAGRGQLALERMVREIREASCTATPPTYGGTQLTFTIPLVDGGTRVITYQQAGNLIQRSSGGGGQTLVEDVGSLAFSAGTVPCLVVIDLTMSKAPATGGEALPLPLQTAVFMRNP